MKISQLVLLIKRDWAGESRTDADFSFGPVEIISDDARIDDALAAELIRRGYKFYDFGYDDIPAAAVGGAVAWHPTVKRAIFLQEGDFDLGYCPSIYEVCLRVMDYCVGWAMMNYAWDDDKLDNWDDDPELSAFVGRQLEKYPEIPGDILEFLDGASD